MTVVAKTREERLALIKEVCDRVNARKASKEKMKKSGKKVLLVSRDEVALRRKKEREYYKKLEALDENPNHYTDAEKYAKQYYGDTYQDTVKFDNEWN